MRPTHLIFILAACVSLALAQQPGGGLNDAAQTSVRIDDLSTPAAPILRALPSVAEVTRHDGERPTHRIIHLLDWHFVSRDDYAADVRSSSDEKLSDTEIDGLYAEFLLEVEAVQAEQRAILRPLIERHGLRSVYVEGLTDENVLAYKAKLAAIKETEVELPKLQRERDELVALLDDGGDDTQEIGQLVERIDAFLAEHRRDMLQIGTAGQLYLTGELDDLLPLEERAAYEVANPLGADGKIKLDQTTIEARQDAQVRRMLSGGPLAFVILGGGNDLADNIERLPGTSVDYVRVETTLRRKLVERNRR